MKTEEILMYEENAKSWKLCVGDYVYVRKYDVFGKVKKISGLMVTIVSEENEISINRSFVLRLPNVDR